MNISIRPIDAEERKIAYSDPELDEPTGCIGHLRGDMGSSGKLFILLGKTIMSNSTISRSVWR